MRLLMFLGILFLPMDSLADSILVDKTLSFGVIMVHPGGDTIFIRADSGPAQAVSESGNSYISNAGRSGKLIYTTSEPEPDPAELIQIVYPLNLTLRCQGNPGETLTIDLLSDNSTQNFWTHDDPQDLHVGGRLTIDPNQYPCLYSGNLLVTFVY